MTCNYSSQAFKCKNEQNSFVGIILCKSMRNHINRSSAKSTEYVLPIAEDKSGDYTCKVTIGTAASSESASSTISTTGLL